MKRVGAGLLLCLAAVLADAATPIYRCGPGGREYSQRPCSGGTVLEGTDGRTAAQRATAARVAEQERRKAAEMERARLAEERKKAAPAVGIDGLARPVDSAASAAASGASSPRSAKTKVKVKPPADFIAVEPGTKKKK